MPPRHQIDTPADLGRLVRARRKTLGLPQEELALAAGTGRRFISELERGKRTARLSDVLAVLHALGLTVELTSPREQGGEWDAGA